MPCRERLKLYLGYVLQTGQRAAVLVAGDLGMTNVHCIVYYLVGETNIMLQNAINLRDAIMKPIK